MQSETNPLPIAWTIGGSDPSAGAGVQADLKTMSALGVHGCSVITSITAQNTKQFFSSDPVSNRALEAQLSSLREEFPPRAVKIGMLDSESNVTAVTRFLSNLETYVICDPVLRSTSGGALIHPSAVEALKRELFPIVDLLTPNIPEAEFLLNRKIVGTSETEQAARDLLEFGVRSVFLKGGHTLNDFCRDFWTDGKKALWLTSRRVSRSQTHGLGCTLSSAVAAFRALGHLNTEALVMAKAYVSRGLRLSKETQSGTSLLFHGPWPVSDADFPWISDEKDPTEVFPDVGKEPLGFYPIVDRAEWVKKFAAWGVRTIQLRIKDLQGEKLNQEIRSAIEIGYKTGCRVFINDYWDLALQFGAYGVHLGQEDLVGADLCSLQKANLRLGVSTHSYAEAARTHALQPSYVALGPIFPTKLKRMEFGPQGVSKIRVWQSILPYPIVAIGGIALDTAQALIENGADGVSVVSDVMGAADIEGRVKAWLDLIGSN